MSTTTTTTTTITTTTSTPAANTNGSTSTKKRGKDADKEGKIIVQFKTKNPNIRVPETPIAVPAKLGRFGLSEVINLLLNRDPPQPFDFLIDTEFIRTSIDKHIRKHNLKGEPIIVIEYTEAVVPPEKEIECEHDDWVSCCAGGFSGYVVTGSYDKRARIWDQRTGECLATVPAHESAIKACAWLSKQAKVKEGKQVYKIATAGIDRVVKTWRVSESGNAKLKHVYKGHVGTVNSIHVSPNGQRMCSGSFDHTIKLWVVKPEGGEEYEGTKRRRLDDAPVDIIDSTTFTGHTASVSSVQWPTATQLISGSWDHSIKAWDVETGIEQNTLVGPSVVHSVSYSSLHALIASAHADTSIRIWDPRVESGKMAQFTLTSHTSWGSGVAWHPYSPHAQFASSSHDGTVKVWDLRSPLPLFTLDSHKDKVLCVDWAGIIENTEGEAKSDVPTRFDLVSGGADNKLRVFKCDSLQKS